MLTEIKKRPGRPGPPKTDPNRKVQVYGYVLKKHWVTAQKEVTELLKKYR